MSQAKSALCPGFNEGSWSAAVRQFLRESDSRGVRRQFGLRRWAEMRLAPISAMSRIAEFEVAQEFLELAPGLSLLDLAGPKIFGLILAQRFALNAWLTDIWEQEVAAWEVWAKSSGWDSPRVRFMTCDARHTIFADRTFDRVVSVSVVEHIDGDGDTAALREIGRILKMGGIAVVTTHLASKFKSRMTRSRFYGQAGPGGEGRLFARIYDWAAIEDRLIRPSGLELVAAAALGIKDSPLSRVFCAYVRDTARPMNPGHKLAYLLTLPFSPLFPWLSRTHRFIADPRRLPSSPFVFDVVLKLRKKD